MNANCYRCPLNLKYPSCNVQCARDMDDMIRTSTSGRIAAFIAEPIQGVGGFITPPKEYFEIVTASSRNSAACSSATKCKPAGDAPAASGSASNNGACSPIS